MSISPHIKAVIFDCDGVLVDSEILGLEESVAFLKSQGLPWEADEVISRFTGYRDDVFRQLLNEAYQEIHGTLPDDSLFTELVAARRRNKHKLKPIEGARRAIEATAASGFAVAVASSSRTQYLESKLQRTNLWDVLAPHVYSAELVAHGKPAPDIFLHAANAINIAPENCLVLEDSVQGVRAGIAASMSVWGFTGGGHCFAGHGERLSEAGATTIVPDFASLSPLLQGLHRE